MIQRIEPVITELEREAESIVVVSHQAVLRVVFGYLTAKSQAEIPSISIPLHTLIELTPMPDGTMSVEYIPVPVNASGLEASIEEAPKGLIMPHPEVASAVAAASRSSGTTTGSSFSNSSWGMPPPAMGAAAAAQQQQLQLATACSMDGGSRPFVTSISVTAGRPAAVSVPEESTSFLLTPGPQYVDAAATC